MDVETSLSEFLGDIKPKKPKSIEDKYTDQIYGHTLQIDWVTAKVPFYFEGTLNGGNIINTTRDGEVEYTIDKRLSLAGSFDSRLSIRTVQNLPSTRFTILIELSGNPVKWFQGHNIFGTDDLVNLVYETVLKLSEVLNAPQPESILKAVREGGFTLSRIDLTSMFSLECRSDVYAFLNHAEKTCRTRSGTSLSKGNTVYMNKDSKRWSVVMYSKGQEIEKHKLPYDLDCPELEKFADNKLRVELRLKSRELKDFNLACGYGWINIEPWSVYSDYVGRIEMTEQSIKDDTVLELPSKVRSTYQLWTSGFDVRQFMSTRTYYRHRKELLKYDIDISVPNSNDELHTNVIPLKRVLELKPSGVPDWAKGTNLYFEPRKFASIG